MKSSSPLTLVGTSRADVFHGGLGGDTIRGLDGNDLLDGGIGNDRIYGCDGDRLLITRTSQVWYDRIDTDGNGVDDATATALHTAASNGRIYAVLENFVGLLDGDDFYGSNINQVTEII